MTENWREEYKKMKRLTARQLELLDKGPDSLAASWAVMAMKYDYNKITGKR
jgi:hypothetical protein